MDLFINQDIQETFQSKMNGSVTEEKFHQMAEKAKMEAKMRDNKSLDSATAVLNNIERIIVADSVKDKKKIPEVKFQLLIGKYLNYISLLEALAGSSLLASYENGDKDKIEKTMTSLNSILNHFRGDLTDLDDYFNSSLQNDLSPKENIDNL